MSEDPAVQHEARAKYVGAGTALGIAFGAALGSALGNVAIGAALRDSGRHRDRCSHVAGERKDAG